MVESGNSRTRWFHTKGLWCGPQRQQKSTNPRSRRDHPKYKDGSDRKTQGLRSFVDPSSCTMRSRRCRLRTYAKEANRLVRAHRIPMLAAKCTIWPTWALVRSRQSQVKLSKVPLVAVVDHSLIRESMKDFQYCAIYTLLPVSEVSLSSPDPAHERSMCASHWRRYREGIVRKTTSRHPELPMTSRERRNLHLLMRRSRGS